MNFDHLRADWTHPEPDRQPATTAPLAAVLAGLRRIGRPATVREIALAAGLGRNAVAERLAASPGSVALEMRNYRTAKGRTGIARLWHPTPAIAMHWPDWEEDDPRAPYHPPRIRNRKNKDAPAGAEAA